MQQKTLDLVGRKHTVEDVERIFHMARELGFDNINMDLIAGLPGETRADMQDTLRRIKALAPDSLTVHALAIKRAAKFGQEGRTMDLHSEISGMVEDAAECAEEMGLKPYYLYRQKNIAGNFENVGYGRKADHPGSRSRSFDQARIAGEDSDGRWKKDESDPHRECEKYYGVYPSY